MEKLELKSFVNHSNKAVVITLATGIFLSLYTLSGAISYQHGVFLNMPKWEEEIPFLTHTIWIYIIYYPLYLLWALASYRDEKNMNKMLYGFVFLTVFSCLLFLILPISYPREFFPLSFENNLTNQIFRAMRKLDKPSNCFPSLHVGLCFFFAFHMKIEGKLKYYFALFSSFLIAVSTLTTKQHYIYDIIGGFILSFGIYAFFNKFTVIAQVPSSKKLRSPNEGSRL